MIMFIKVSLPATAPNSGYVASPSATPKFHPKGETSYIRKPSGEILLGSNGILKDTNGED